MPTEVIAYNIAGAVIASGFSRADLYRKASRGEVIFLKNGRRTLVDGASLRRCVANLPSTTPKSSGVTAPEASEAAADVRTS